MKREVLPEARSGGSGKIGLRGRLLLAFVGISMFSVVAGLSGHYAFNAVTKALDRTGATIPPALAAVELTRESEQVLAAGPRMLNAKTDGEVERLWTVATGDLKTVDNLVGQVRTATIDPRALDGLSSNVSKLRDTLSQLKETAIERVRAATRREKLINDTFSAYRDFGTAWNRNFAELQSQVLQLRTTLSLASSTQERRSAIDRFDLAVATLLSLEQIQREAGQAYEFVTRGASIEDGVLLQAQASEARRAMRALEGRIDDLERELAAGLIEPARRLNAIIVGKEGLFITRHLENEAVRNGQRLITTNVALGDQLSVTVSGLVDRARKDIDTATLEARAVQQFGGAIQLGVVALSLISSVLIVWLYVGQNLIHRLMQLSGGMLAIAAGRQHTPIEIKGTDEIAAMAQVVEVFRKNTLERDELLTERAEAATRLEGIVEERTAELQERGNTLRVTFDNMDHGVVMFDDEFKLTSWNRQIVQLLELPESLLTGRQSFADFVHFLAKQGEYGDVDADAQLRKLTAEAGRHYSFERIRPNGTVLEIKHNPLPGGEMVIIYTDVTERKRYEEALTAARDQAEAMSRTKSSFLANMSHELRTPLNAIIGVTEMLQEDARDLKREDEVEPLGRVLRAARHLLALINDILDLSKIETGKMELSLEFFAVTPLIDEVVKTLETLAAKNGNRVIVDCSPKVGTIHADQMRLRQALLNLASNANKFTERGMVTISADRREEGDREWIAISVADTGIGMTAEQVGKLFQEFSQADASTTRKYGGTGLGLAISRRFCQMMGGDITVKSESGRGSLFTIRLPVIAQDSAVQSAASMRLPLTITKDGAPLILVVDDDVTVREVVGRYLERAGFTVASADDGQEGLRLARELHPAAMTLDIMMPGIDGWTVLAAIKGDPELQDIPVVLLTIVDEKNRGFSLGASEYLVKPVDRDKLTGVLRSVVGSRDRRVLVVDDDDIGRKAVRAALQQDGWSVTEAENGRLALDQLAKDQPSAIILDLMMPEMDGFTFLDEVRRRPEWRAIPIVVITAKDLTAEDRSHLNGGVERIIAKTGDGDLLNELLGALTQCIERRNKERLITT